MKLVRFGAPGCERPGILDEDLRIPSCEAPHGISMDYAARRLFVSCLNALLLVVDADNGHVVASLPRSEAATNRIGERSLL
jgi:glucose dehydrogenase